MSQYKNKSAFNLSAAALLLDGANCLYAPSVHCSYYSCIQYMLFIIHAKLPVDVKNDYIQKNSVEGSSHTHAINIIEGILIKKKQDDYKSFQKAIKELKKTRVQSDYHDVSIEQGVGQKAYGLAQSILNILSTNFK